MLNVRLARLGLTPLRLMVAEAPKVALNAAASVFVKPLKVPGAAWTPLPGASSSQLLLAPLFQAAPSPPPVQWAAPEKTVAL